MEAAHDWLTPLFGEQPAAELVRPPLTPHSLPSQSESIFIIFIYVFGGVERERRKIFRVSTR